MGEENQWSCPICTFANNDLLPTCEICETSKPIPSPRPSSSHLLEDYQNFNFAQESHDNSFTDPSANLDFSTDGLIGLMSACLKEKKQSVSLCWPCRHFTQKGSYGAKWSCGYRNIQMLCSALMEKKEYKARLFDGTGKVPSITALQSWIEKAWKAGFDVEGSGQFGDKLVGTETWIGTTECAALLRSFGIRAMIIDFEGSAEDKAAAKNRRCVGCDNPLATRIPQYWVRCYPCYIRWGEKKRKSAADYITVVAGDRENANFRRKRQKTEGERTEIDNNSSESSKTDQSGDGKSKVKAYSAVSLRIADWLCRYFSLEYTATDRVYQSSSSSSFSSSSEFLPPLYFQHEGHSRTIVGISFGKTEQAQKEKGQGQGNKDNSDQTMGKYVGSHGRGSSDGGHAAIGRGGGGSRCKSDSSISSGCRGAVVSSPATITPKVEALYIFDPENSKMGQVKDHLENGNLKWHPQVKRCFSTLKKAEYQILYIEPGFYSEDELEDSKIMKGEKF